MKLLCYCLVTLLYVLNRFNSSYCIDFHYCSWVDHAVFIVSRNPQDSTTYSLHRDFFLGLTEHLINPRTKVSLLVFYGQEKGDFIFSICFENVTRKIFTPDLIYQRPNKTIKVQSIADISTNGPLIVTINVKLPRLFYEYVVPSMRRTHFFEIFTDSQQNRLLHRPFLKEKSIREHGVVQTLRIKGDKLFQSLFDTVYEDMCWFMEEYIFRNFHRTSPCYELECSVTYTTVKNSEDVRLRMHSLHGHWAFVVIKPIFSEFNSYSLQTPSQVCSKEGMNLITIRNKEMAKDIVKVLTEINVSQVLQYYIFGWTIPNLDQFIIGLVRRKSTIGRRFAWVTGKELTFADWSRAEPKGGDRRECVHWKFNTTTWNDEGWQSTGCGNAGKIIFCQDERSTKKFKIYITESFSESLFHTVEQRKYGEIHFENNHENLLKLSMSFAISSGFLIETVRESNWSNLGLKNYIHGEHQILQPEHNIRFINELQQLFYLCSEDIWHATNGVPYSQVCDGVIDCKSGRDESFCEETGYLPCSTNEFTCASKQCIPSQARCDLVPDCQDASDETGCELNCRHRQCGTGRCLPSSWFHDGQVDCFDNSDEDSAYEKQCIFICNMTECVTREMLNDGIFDCRGPEGPLDETLGALESFNCTNEEKVFFINNWAPRCVLFYDRFREIIGCRDLSHLENCHDFVCPPGYAKCPHSFCIPLGYLNDEKEDCDYGQDEGANFENHINLFKCHPLRSQYVPMSSVCDGRKDCSQGEDEIDCSWACYPGFICLAGSISAPRHGKGLAPSNWSFISPKVRHVDISGVQTPDFFHIYPLNHFNYVFWLNLSRCGIEDILLGKRVSHSCKNENGLNDFRSVKFLDLSHNKISRIHDCSALSFMQGLKNLDLSHNVNLKDIGNSITDLIYLKSIDFSYTSISKLPQNVFLKLINLEVLILKQTHLTAIDFILPKKIRYFDIEDTDIKTVAGDVFIKSAASSLEIYSSTYKLCCTRVLGSSSRQRKCHFPEHTAVSSCEDMIEEQPLRAMLWLVGFATLGGNIVTLLYRLTWDREILLKSYGVFVTNLGISDTLMGCYLVTIAVADMKFQGEYVLYENAWKESLACFCAGTIATVSGITSNLFVFLITVERFLAVRFPFGEVRFNKITLTAAVIGAWLFGISIAALLFMPFADDWVIYSNSGMCVGLPLNHSRLPGWQYSLSLFVGLNFVLFVLIGAGQIAIFMKVKEKAKRTRKNLSRQSQQRQHQREQQFAIAKKLSLVVMSNFLCWFPIIVLGIITVCGKDVGAAAYRWSAIAILPVNSALNPLLYTLPELKQKMLEFIEAHKEAAKNRKKASVASPTCFKGRWRRKVKTVIAMRQRLEQGNYHEDFTLVELETLKTKLTNLRAAC